MLKENYNLIMDPEVNGLWRLPKIVRFHFMSILAFMWSAIFTVWTGWISLFGPSATVHVILLAGVFFTADVFRRANQKSQRQLQLVHSRDAMRNKPDCTVLYDDLGGAP